MPKDKEKYKIEETDYNRDTLTKTELFNWACSKKALTNYY